MKLSFKQGIVQHQTDTFNTPTFLMVSGGYVSLMTNNDPTIITFTQGDKDYLLTERQTVNNAWGPFTTGDHWLYWQLNLVTGTREFGTTNLEPVVAFDPPSAPGAGQTWFNSTSNVMYEFNGSSWVEVVRVFACKLASSTTPLSMSINTPDFRGTQTGLNVSSNAGSLVFDLQGKPIKTSDRKFFTTEDQFFTGVPTGARLKVGNILIPGIAQQPLHKHQVVEFTDFNEILPASPFTYLSKLYGIIEEDAPSGDVVNFVIEGTIYDEDWDWVLLGAEVNDPVFIDDTGEIQINPFIGGQLPVGIVIGTHEILFSPKTFALSPSTQTSVDLFTDLLDTPNNFVGAANQVVSVNAFENGLEFTVGSGGSTNFTELTDTPTTYTGSNDLFVKVNSGANGLEFTTLPPSSSLFTELTDTPTNFVGAANQVVSVNSLENGLEFTPSSSLPASTQECQYLVADNSGGWLEQAPLTLPEPYDIACFIEGESPSTSTRVLQCTAPRKFVLLDYGHQASFYSVTGPSTDTTYNIHVATTNQTGAIRGTITFPSTGLPIIQCSETQINVGDRVYIESPSTPDPDLTNVSITLRGYAMPISCPNASLPTVSFNSSLYTNKGEFVPSDITITGSWSFVEWAITEYSDDNGYSWMPFDNGYLYNGSPNTEVNSQFNDGPFTFEHFSSVIKTVDYLPTNLSGTTGVQFRIQLSIYGPNGKDHATTIMQWT